MTQLYQNPNEKWEYVPGYEGKYQISTLGRVYNRDRDLLMKLDGGNKVSLTKDGVAKGWGVHVLMGF